MIILHIQEIVYNESPLLQLILGFPSNCYLFSWAYNILKQHKFMAQLNILDMKSINITTCHLFGSDKSPDLGTGTHWILFQILESDLSWQKSLMKSNTHVLKYSSMDLNDSVGTPFNPDVFTLLIPLFYQFNLSQVIGSSIWHIDFCCLII